MRAMFLVMMLVVAGCGGKELVAGVDYNAQCPACGADEKICGVECVSVGAPCSKHRDCRLASEEGICCMKCGEGTKPCDNLCIPEASRCGYLAGCACED